MLPGRKKPVFLYDSDCGICTRFTRAVSFLDAQDKVSFMSIAAAEANGELDAMNPVLRYRSSHLVTPKGSIESGGDGMVALLSYLPGGFVPARMIASFPPALRGARWIYRVLSRLHGGPSCDVGGSPSTSPLRHKGSTYEWRPTGLGGLLSKEM